MAWIESHTVLIRHRKLLQLAVSLSLRPVEVLGHLTALWHSALEQQEDGNLADWPDEMIAEAAHYKGDPKLFVAELQSKRWLDGRLLHDWIDYAGRYLESKYRRSNPRKLNDILKIHKARLKTGYSQALPRLKPAHLPNLTLPNLNNKDLKVKDVGANGSKGVNRRTRLPDEEWIKTLESDPTYSGIDIQRELGKCQNHFRVKGITVSRLRFVNWLNRVDKPLAEPDYGKVDYA